jgi:hypothetical protein
MKDNYTLKPGPVVPQDIVDMMVTEYEGGCGEAHLYKLLTELAHSHTTLRQALDIAESGLEYYADKSLGTSGAWCFRKRFCFDITHPEDLETLPEPIGEKGQKYVIGGKTAREALTKIRELKNNNKGEK